MDYMAPHIPTSVAECYELMADLESDIAEIDDQLLEAKQTQKATGEYADPIWFRNANYALSKKTADRLRLNGTLIRLKREEAEDEGFYDAVGRVVVEEWDADSLAEVAEAVGERYPEYADVISSMVAREAA